MHAILAFALGFALFAPPALAAAPATGVMRLVGTWNCAGSARGSASEHAYTSPSDTTLVLQAVVHTSFGVTGNVVETFSYERANDTWTLRAGSNQFFDEMRLTARGPSGNEWAFSGSQSTQGTTLPIRIVYRFTGADTFVRLHQRGTEGRWLDDGALTCRRTGVVAAAPSPTARARQASPAPRPSMQQAAASIPRRSASEPPGRTVPPGPVPGLTPTPLPIPGILPAEDPNVRPRPTVRPTSARVAAAPRPSNSPVRPSPSPTASGAPRPTPQPSVTRTTTPHPATTPTRGAVRTAAVPAPAQDRAYRLTGSTWACETLGGLPATHEYTLQPDGALKLHNVLTIGKHQYGIDETYRFDRSKNAWTTTTGGDAYVGVAPQWLHAKWTFDGTMPAGKRRIPVQMIYSSLGDTAFRRDFVKFQDGSWKTFAAETCHRP